MINTIEEFNQKIDELKKRLKAISVSQNTLSKLNALLDYFDQIQEYLNDINTAFSDHIAESEDYSSSIANLQTQVEQIEQKLQNLPDFNELDLTQMQTDISTLKTDLSTLKGNSTNSIFALDEQISTINADISTIKSDIFNLSSNISTNTNDISALKTTTQNQATTINNLTSAQTTHANSISTLNNKVSSLESEVSAITGGIDLTELDESIKKLELSSGESYSFRDYNYGFNPSNKTLYTREYYFSVDMGKSIKEVYELCYDSTATGTMTVELIKNHISVQSFDIDLNQFPNKYKFYYKFISSTHSQATKLKITATTDFTFNQFNMEVFGTGITQYRYDDDVKVACFNGEIYITRYVDNLIKYGKFSTDDEIDLDNLPNTINRFDENNNGYTFCQFIAYPYIKGGLKDVSDVLVSESIDNKFITKVIKQPDEYIQYDKSITAYGSGLIITGCYSGIRSFIIKNDTPHIIDIDVENPGYSYVVPTGTKWKYVKGVAYNNYYIGDSYLSMYDTKCIALNEDGYFYLFTTLDQAKTFKIAKGDNVYAFCNGDIINIYINKGNDVVKYKATKITSSKYSVELICVINDCDCIYETYNNKIIKHNISSNSWSIETLEY